MKFYVKSSLTLAALALAMLAMTQMASAQAQRASDKARGFYGPAASPDAADGFELAPGVTGERITGEPTGRIRRFSYAPAPAPARAPAPAAAPQARAVQPAQPAPATRAPAASMPARRYSYSYQAAPVNRNGFFTNDRVLSGNPANRNAAAKPLGVY